MLYICSFGTKLSDRDKMVALRCICKQFYVAFDRCLRVTFQGNLVQILQYRCSADILISSSYIVS